LAHLCRHGGSSIRTVVRGLTAANHRRARLFASALFDEMRPESTVWRQEKSAVLLALVHMRVSRFTQPANASHVDECSAANRTVLMEAWIVVVRHGACPFRYPVQNPRYCVIVARSLYPRAKACKRRKPERRSCRLLEAGSSVWDITAARMDREACLTNVLHAGQQAHESETSRKADLIPGNFVGSSRSSAARKASIS
jgi:hypothetical protein